MSIVPCGFKTSSVAGGNIEKESLVNVGHAKIFLDGRNRRIWNLPVK